MLCALRDLQNGIEPFEMNNCARKDHSKKIDCKIPFFVLSSTAPLGFSLSRYKMIGISHKRKQQKKLSPIFMRQSHVYSIHDGLEICFVFFWSEIAFVSHASKVPIALIWTEVKRRKCEDWLMQIAKSSFTVASQVTNVCARSCMCCGWK